MRPLANHIYIKSEFQVPSSYEHTEMTIFQMVAMIQFLRT